MKFATAEASLFIYELSEMLIAGMIFVTIIHALYLVQNFFEFDLKKTNFKGGFCQ